MALETHTDVHVDAQASRPRVAVELLKLLYRNARISLAGVLLCAALLSIMQWSVASHALIVSWFSFVLLVVVARHWSFICFDRVSPSVESIPHWRKVFMWGVAASALGWGWAAWVLFPSQSLLHQMFLVFILAGVCSGAVSSLGASVPAVSMYLLISLVPLSLRFLVEGSAIHMAMALSMPLYVGILLQTARHLNAALVTSLQLGIENKMLAEVLSTARDDAESANQAKSRFLANMSHEIRTPMNGLIGTLDLLERTELSSDQAMLLSTTKASADNLMHILNDILDFAKVEAGQLRIEDIAVGLRGAIEKVLRVHRVQVEQKGLALELVMDPNLPEVVRCDPVRLQQVLNNLMSNAIKFTDAGRVVLRVGLEENAEGGRLLRFAVEDTGIGIDPEQSDRLFAPFTQADLSTTRRFGGTGLGLSISRHLIELMGGTIGVTATRGPGTCFWFLLPCHEASAADAEACVPEAVPEIEPPVEVAALPPGGLKVLLAEDNPVNQLVAQKMLEQMGCQVTVVSDGRQAVMLTRENEFELIFMDWQMPELDGVAATRLIRQDDLECRRQRTPIVALTAHALKGDREECEAAGMDDYLTKPLQREALQAVLLRWGRPTGGDVPGTRADP